MGFIAWIILGLVVGAIVRQLSPGRVEGGWLASLILGVAGALLGGWISATLFHIDVNNSIFELKTWLFAIIGGVICTYIYSFIKGKS